jgi:hypothetical protein
MATSELNVGKGIVLDNNSMKDLFSGGKTVCVRENHKEEFHYRIEGIPWVFAIDLPEILNFNTDDAAQNTVVFIERYHRYLEGVSTSIPLPSAYIQGRYLSS